MTQAQGAAPVATVETVIVEASLAAKWLVQEDDSDLAQRMLDTWVAHNVRLVVPPHFYAECASIVYKRITRKQLTLDEALLALETLHSVEIAVHADPRLTLSAVTVCARYILPSAYDGHYVALAEIYNAPLWTADRRLVNALQGRSPLVKWIGDFLAA